MNIYREMTVWKKSIQLCTEVYKITKLLPTTERYVLCEQMQRAAISVPSNIAEGSGRTSKKEFVHFLSISRGSLFELETQTILCKQLEYISEDATEDFDILSDEITKMLTALIKKYSE